MKNKLILHILKNLNIIIFHITIVFIYKIEFLNWKYFFVVLLAALCMVIAQKTSDYLAVEKYKNVLKSNVYYNYEYVTSGTKNTGSTVYDSVIE